MTIFTSAATSHERVMLNPIPGREAIRAYWQAKVVEAQANITCRLLNLYLDGDTAIAKWEAEFDDMAQGLRKRIERDRGAHLRGAADRVAAGVLGVSQTVPARPEMRRVG